MAYFLVTIGLILCAIAALISCNELQSSNRNFSRCDLIHELVEKYYWLPRLAATWTCLAIQNQNSSVENDQIKDNLLDRNNIQISDIYKCYDHELVRPCFLLCSELIELDADKYMECMKRIYEKERDASGNGFSNVPTYQALCQDKSDEYLNGCNVKAVVRPIQKSIIYDRCDLAEELFIQQNVPLEDVGVWVCLASRDNYNASLVGPLAVDGENRHYGLWHISSKWWCSQDGRGGRCQIECSKLTDIDVTDDLECARKIYEETAQTGDGFTAWPYYTSHCKEHASDYVKNCEFGSITDEMPAMETTTTPRTVTLPSSVIAINDTEHQESPQQLQTVNGNKQQSNENKILEVCNVAKQLENDTIIHSEQINIWLCIIESTSKFSTDFISDEYHDGSREHGLFGISDNYWCSRNGPGMACNITCDQLHDDDLSDDIACAQKIKEAGGFSAWPGYNQRCRDGEQSYRRRCDFAAAVAATQRPTNSSGPTTTKTPVKGKIYGLCELAVELRFKFNIPESLVNPWICIIENESNFNTSHVAGDANEMKYGLFNIPSGKWCGDHTNNARCKIDCNKLIDSDISDDLECAIKVYLNEQAISNAGLKAWPSYLDNSCNEKPLNYTSHCYANLSDSEMHTGDNADKHFAL